MYYIDQTYQPDIEVQQHGAGTVSTLWMLIACDQPPYRGRYTEAKERT